MNCLERRAIRIWSVGFTGVGLAIIGMGLVGIGMALGLTAGPDMESADQAALGASFLLCMSGGVAGLVAAGAMLWAGGQVDGPSGRWLIVGGFAVVVVLFACTVIALDVAETRYGWGRMAD